MTPRLNSWCLAAIGLATFAVTVWAHHPRAHVPAFYPVVAARTSIEEPALVEGVSSAADGLPAEPVSPDTSAANPSSPEPSLVAGVAADESDAGFVLAARPLPPASGAGPPEDVQTLPNEDPTVDDLPERELPSL